MEKTGVGMEQMQLERRNEVSNWKEDFKMHCCSVLNVSVPSSYVGT